MTAVAEQIAVLGDGTTLATRTTRRWKASRLILGGLTFALCAAFLLSVLTPDQSTVRFAADNPSGDGGMALAQVLRGQGVDVVATTSVAGAIGAAGPGTTLLVAEDYGMGEDVARSLVDTGADLVLVTPGPALLAATTDEVVHAGRNPDPGPVPAGCSDPDARAAGQITSNGAGFMTSDGSSGTTLCFVGAAGAGHYVIFPLASDPSVTVRALDDATGLTNDAVLTAGNAALGLRMLGHQDRLVWLVPERPAPVGEPGGELTGLLPPWAVPVGLQLVLVVVVAAVWRGRRLGPLATEDLPVVAVASETTLGRGRLYRRSRAYGHAGASLRAGAADRMASLLGLPRSASPEALVEAVARASAHRPEQVAALLYGPPPTGDVELTRLATDLDTLESEVHHL